MRAFSSLFRKIEQTNSTNTKIDALETFFREADEEDKLWAIALFTHKRPKRTINTRMLRNWAAEKAGISEWLFEDSYHIVGDLAETIALLLPPPDKENALDLSLSQWIREMIDLKESADEDKKIWLWRAWAGLDKDSRFLLNKLITGGFRLGISQRLITKALARYLDEDESSIAHRLMGDWSPLETSFQQLLCEEDASAKISRPYPFYLAYALDVNLSDLGKPMEWMAEWKWDGIRGQLIHRNGEIFIWSRGEELVTDRFPELSIPFQLQKTSFVMDGEILGFKEGKPLHFQELQKRIGRKKVSKAVIQKCPVVFMAYDLLEKNGSDIRSCAFGERRQILKDLIENLNNEKILLSPEVPFSDWKQLAELIGTSRERRTEGFMLKNLSSTYKDGRKKGDWWKWKIDPYTIDAVMIYAQRGHGRRANLFTDYTFALWDNGELVTFTKAYHGLTDEEFRQISTFVRKNTIDRYGPVHAVEPSLVFEIAFEGIQLSSRHKSGIALRFPRISRWRKDKKPEEANTLSDIMKFLPAKG